LARAASDAKRYRPAFGERVSRIVTGAARDGPVGGQPAVEKQFLTKFNSFGCLGVIGNPHTQGREKSRHSLWFEFSLQRSLEQWSALGFASADRTTGSMVIPDGVRGWSVTDFGALRSAIGGLVSA